MELQLLSRILEAIIFVSDQPVQTAFLLEVLNGRSEVAAGEAPDDDDPAAEVTTRLDIDMETLQAALDLLLSKYADETYPFEIRKIAGGYQFFTKKTYYPYLRRFVVQKNQKRLSRAALETLSIIAYRQPITKTEVEFIRGVNCDYAMQKLLDKQLVRICGRSDAPGRPLLYETSPFFMQYFGISDMTDLPKLKEFEELAEDHLDQFRQHQEEQQKHHGKEAPAQAVEENTGNGAAEPAE
ncbi:MAG: hypothetical protein OHK0039_36730 [Bacteroidia bacterium]